MRQSAHRILLIDPDDDGRQRLADRLSNLGYSVATACDGVAGAHSALESPPEVVIADLMMPSISGAQLCRLLKGEPATEHIPVILRGPPATGIVSGRSRPARSRTSSRAAWATSSARWRTASS